MGVRLDLRVPHASAKERDGFTSNTNIDVDGRSDESDAALVIEFFLLCIVAGSPRAPTAGSHSEHVAAIFNPIV